MSGLRAGRDHVAHDTTPGAEAPSAPSAGPPGALEGLCVLELGTLIAGPFAGRILADNGADVIKIEAPDRPDPLRSWGQVIEGDRGLFWTIHARNKRCVTLDLRVERGQEILLDLVARADVVIESFRPGTLESWGLGYDRLSGVNPRIVLARVSGYGQTGPDALLPGYASMAEAKAGLRYITGFPGQPPVRTSLSIGDSLAGMFAAQGILAALVALQRTRTGQVVDVALTDSCLALTESMIPDYDRAGWVREPSGTRLDKIAPSNIYRSLDDQWVIVAANQDSVFTRLCTALGQPELAADPRYATHTARAAHQDQLDVIIGEWVARRPAADVVGTLEANGVVAGSISTVADIVKDPQFIAREMVVPHFDQALGVDVLGPGVTPRLSATPGSVRWAGSPAPGTHNNAVYGGLLGLGPSELDELHRAGVI